LLDLSLVRYWGAAKNKGKKNKQTNERKKEKEKIN
jgi:hypothetical protein